MCRNSSAILLLWMSWSCVWAASSPNPDADGPRIIEHPEWFKASFLDIREDMEEAISRERHLVLYIYQDGCPYCKLFIEDTLRRPDILSKVRANFDIVAVNMYGSLEVTDLDGSALPESEFVLRHGVQFTPTLLVYGLEGKPALRMNGYYPPDRFRLALRYLIERRYLKEEFSDYAKHAASERGSGFLYTGDSTVRDVSDLSLRQPEKPLLVLCEEKQCWICDELHQDIFQRDEIQAFLKGTEVAVLDMHSDSPLITPAGKRTTPHKWAEQISAKVAPTFVWFNADGQEVFRNEGYIKAFHLQSMLDYVASEGYLSNPEFQRWIIDRAKQLEAQGVEVDMLH